MPAKPTPADDTPRRLPAFLSPPARAALIEVARSMESDPRWQAGRQGTGYEKLDLRASGVLESKRDVFEQLMVQARVSFAVEYKAWDAYILRYRDGAFVPDHVDPTDSQRHLRLNAIISAADEGTGELRLEGVVFDLAAGDAVCFRPDRVLHRISAVRGERLVLSVGCVY